MLHEIKTANDGASVNSQFDEIIGVYIIIQNNVSVSSYPQSPLVNASLRLVISPSR